MKKQISSILSALLFTTSAFANTGTAEKTRKPNDVLPERPPQYVLLAFDGSQNLSFWQNSLDWADTQTTNEKTEPLRFTYFINPSYYVELGNKSVYTTPGLNNKHLACIGWAVAGPDSNYKDRLKYTNRAFTAGHDIGSHAIAHCDQTGKEKDDPMYGHPWAEAEWSSEFDQFNKIFFNLFEINKEKSKAFPYAFSQADIVGFRAPKLAVTEGLWPTLKRYNFRYDTSKIAQPNYWPQKNDYGTWNFPLGDIRIAGTKSRHVLSMDYNWLVYHSGASSKPELTDEEREAWRKQVYDSYMYYFKTNYFGGRAPVNIGHHFSQWNRGAYWSAMKDFAKAVCNRKEVRCVTYKKYTDWLDSLPQDVYAKYRSGQFPRLPDDKTIQDIAAPAFMADVRLDRGNGAFETMIADADRAKAKALGWKPVLSVNFKPFPKSVMTKAELIKFAGNAKDVLIRASVVNRSGKEMNWETYKITNLGKPDEKIDDRSIESRASEGEGADAHNIPENAE